MSRPTADPILSAILTAATEATGATSGLLLSTEDRLMRVVATAGAVPADILGEPISAGEGVAGYVAASGQSLVLSADSADPRLGEGTASLIGHNPTSVLAVAIQGTARTLGVIELLDARSGAFSVDDTERATSHAAIAAAALTDERLGGTRDVPEPAELAAELRRLASTDPARYATVAAILEALVR
ncbi:GAF domain-containing protein [Euzebya tangerina]|uniref:GAF domain-containing protein n=1 Tax=Euzebya tangerina TaxID=591198 RepID=UPI000E3241B9|nr:GAF domain-containing protein [Euzebya tangerina]